MKHAYLIMAHNQFDLLKRLIQAIDNVNNDIYIHIDSKADFNEFGSLGSVCRYSCVFFTKERINVVWGHYSQIKCELELFKTAYQQGEYSYYHLISGADFLLKPAQEIYDYFEKNYPAEFVHIDSSVILGDNYDKMHRYFWLQKKVGNADSKSLIYCIQRILIRIQRCLGIRRNDDINFYKGANWLSITNNLVEEIICKEKWISSVFRFTLCCDEVFVQTILMNSELKKNIYVKKFADDYRACMRLIDWKRGSPYVYKESDYEELTNSELMFARKFNYSDYPQIIDMLMEKNIK